MVAYKYLRGTGARSLRSIYLRLPELQRISLEPRQHIKQLDVEVDHSSVARRLLRRLSGGVQEGR